MKANSKNTISSAKLLNINEINFGSNKINTVNARELHKFLQVQTKFTDWIKLIIDKYTFVKNTNYITLTKNMVRGVKHVEHYITIDMAKKLATAEHNTKGTKVSKYFVDIEKKCKEQLNNNPINIDKFFTNSNTILQIANKWKKDRNKLIKVEKELSLAKPKLNYFDQVLQSKSLVNINQIAKDYGYSAKAFNKLLSSLKIQYKQNGQWLLYAKYHNRGYTSSNTMYIKHSDGTNTTIIHTMWTQKGRMFLYEMLKTNGILPVIEGNNCYSSKFPK